MIINKKPKTDKQLIKFEYENIPISNVQIAKNHGVTAVYICQLAKVGGWKKCSQAIEIPREPVNGNVVFNEEISYAPSDKKNDLLANMTIDLAERMVTELHCYTPIIGQIEQWIIQATADDANDKRRKIMLKAVSFSQRANDLKTLANILVQTRGVIMSGKVVGTGKKEQADAKADAVSKGKFAPSAAPLRIAK